MQNTNLEFAFVAPRRESPRLAAPLDQQLAAFREFSKETRVLAIRATTFDSRPLAVPTYVNEFWTAKQRAASSLHEVSYRACFKPQLPRFFVERLTAPGDKVYDPFMGRGTTLVEAGLLGRVPYGCDVNPLSVVLTKPRLHPPTLQEINNRLAELDFSRAAKVRDDLLVFYHPDTLKEICALRDYLVERHVAGANDFIDDWIQMVAVNRLTGHSPGFFSVYTLPPNQAVSIKSQQKINEKRRQQPPRRHVAELISRKSRQLLSECDAPARQVLARVSGESRLMTQQSNRTPQIKSGTVSLVVTSPPFLNVVDYATDNWLRCWFIGLDAASVKLTVPRRLDDWQEAMTEVFHELHRVLKPGGHVAFEVGEVHGGATRLEEAVVPCGVAAGLDPLLIVINDQKFTKTANCWGVDNNARGTNTNRIVVFRK